MATPIQLRGQTIRRSGVYTDTKSGVQNPPVTLSSGNVCIVDTGMASGWANGASVNGELTQGKDALYNFSNIIDFRNFIKGGYLYLLAEPLFLPGGSDPSISGVSTLYYIKAGTTTAATITFNLTNGSLTFKTKNEGSGANGVVNSGILTTGYGCKLIAGIQDPSKYIIQFWLGNFHGLDPQNNNQPYDGITDVNSVPVLITQTPEVSNIDEVVLWCESDIDFINNFTLAFTGYGVGLGLANLDVYNEFTPGDLVSYVGYNLATGGTESYSDADFDAALKIVKDIDCASFLSTDYFTNAQSLSNTKLLNLVSVLTKYQKYLYIGGGKDKNTFATGISGNSQDTAVYYNSDSVITVHGGIRKKIAGLPSYKVYDSMYKTCLAVGRVHGLDPEVAITLKTLNIDGDVANSSLSDDDQEFALKYGILYSYFDTDLNAFVFGQDVNTLQKNNYLVNNDGTSFSISVKRICSQLNKGIIINAKQTFYSGNSGPNRSTVSEQDIVQWLSGYLKSQLATSTQDNLIISYGNINITTVEDNYFITYEFVPNFEISKMIFTGFVLES